MRVAFLSWRDTTHPDGGGSELYVERVAAGLAHAGHEVTVFCAAHGIAPRRERRDGFRLRRRGGRLTVYLRGLLWLLSAEGRRQDVVVDVINGLPFGSVLVRRRGVVGLVHHVHRAQWRIIYPGLAGRVGWFVEGRLVPRLYRRTPMVTVSEASRGDLVRLGFDPARVRVVRNGTPALPDPTTARATSPRICVLSRLVPHKQIEHAVDAAVALAPDHPGLRLDVIGDGWWADRLDAYVAERGAGDLVVRHGHVDEQAKADLLHHAWVMVLPSVQEGWGVAILEAAAAGTPTVAYAAAGGTRESVVDGVTGLLVDEGGLADGVRTLLEDDDLRERMGTAARKRAAGFDWSETTAAFAAALHSP